MQSSIKFELRPWELSDLQSLVRHANNPNIARYMTNAFPHPYTEVNGTAFIAFASQQTPRNIFAITVNEEAVGGIGLHHQSDIYSRNAELGYWIGEDYWGKGIVTEAVRQMVSYGFHTWNIDRIFARPFGSNTASQKVLKKTGFILEAHFKKTIFKNGAYEDEMVFGIRKKVNP